jgi:cellulose synthase/poly-beta-1,6-N-acetylglucosamine synthase-like glycosyltransferase
VAAQPVVAASGAPQFGRASVSAVMVVRNEEAVIAHKLENLLTLDYPPEKLEVVVVSDGSSDGTAAILGEFARSAGANGYESRVARQGGGPERCDAVGARRSAALHRCPAAD